MSDVMRINVTLANGTVETFFNARLETSAWFLKVYSEMQEEEPKRRIRKSTLIPISEIKSVTLLDIDELEDTNGDR